MCVYIHVETWTNEINKTETYETVNLSNVFFCK